MKKLCLVLGLTLTASLLAACGGSSDSSDSTSASGGDELSKSEWIAQADGICRDYQDEAEDLTTEFEALEISSSSSSQELTQASELLRQIGGKAEGEIDSLRQLEPPSKDEETIDSMLTKVEESNEIGLQAADALAGGDEAELEEIVGEGNEIKAEAEDLAEGYGLEVCGS